MTHVLGMLAAIALTAFCWGVYGPVLHFGRDYMESALRPFVCVGLAYFLIAVIAPVVLLWRGGVTVAGGLFGEVLIRSLSVWASASSVWFAVVPASLTFSVSADTIGGTSTRGGEPAR